MGGSGGGGRLGQAKDGSQRPTWSMLTERLRGRRLKKVSS